MPIVNNIFEKPGAMIIKEEIFRIQAALKIKLKKAIK